MNDIAFRASRRLFLLGGTAALAGCAVGLDGVPATIPNAYFVFFERDSAEPIDGDVVLNEVAAVLKKFPQLRVRVVGARSELETEVTEEGATIDQIRAVTVGNALTALGVEKERIETVAIGNSNSIAAQADGDAAVDQRVDIIIVNQA